MKKDEQAAIQVLFKGAVNSWSESIIRSVMDNQGDAFFQDAPEMLPLAKEKIEAPLFAVVMKIIGQGPTVEKANNIAVQTGTAFVRFYNSPHNSLIPIYNEAYSFDLRCQDVLLRQSHRLGMLLNSFELMTIVHIPSSSVTSLKFERDTKRTKAAPAITKGHELVLGINRHQREQNVVSVSASQRLKHTHVIGATGTGKSTFLLNLIVQDITQGKGLAVLDPHGDLIESILTYIPEERIQDVVIIDQAAILHPFN